MAHRHGKMPGGISVTVYGSYCVDGDPGAFYRRARDGPELALVKTHPRPRDAEKAIHVIRDGRPALPSFLGYQATRHPGASTFDAPLLGDHLCGDWTGHYRAWRARAGEALVVRLQEPVAADAAVLERLAAFLGLPAPACAWSSPRAELRTRPGLLRGRRPGVAGGPVLDARPASRLLHAPRHAAGRAGVRRRGRGACRRLPPGSGEERWLRSAHALAARRCQLQAVCDERSAEIERLKAECDARGALLT